LEGRGGRAGRSPVLLELPRGVQDRAHRPHYHPPVIPGGREASSLRSGGRGDGQGRGARPPGAEWGALWGTLRAAYPLVGKFDT